MNADLHPPAHRPPNAHRRWRRVRRYLETRAWLHALLIGFALVFLYPFLWMAALSIKTDEEVSEPGVMPRIPTFLEESPYARPVPDLIHPADISDAAEDIAIPRMIEASRAAAGDASRVSGIQYLDREALLDAAQNVLFNLVAAQLPRSLWKGEAAALGDRFAELITPELARAAVENRVARFEWKSLRIQALDGTVRTLWSDESSIDAWQLSGPGELRRDADGEPIYLHYRFPSTGSALTLEYKFPFPFKPEDLHKIILSVRGDDSWHRVNATLDIGNQRWTSRRTTYIAQHRGMSLVFQPPTFDDTTYRAKTWVPLKEIASGAVASAAGAPATLRIEILPSSTLQAIIGKVQRNYWRAFYYVPFWTYVGNSLLLVVLATLGVLFSSSFVGYAFARLRWPGRGIAFVILLSTMMLPAQVTMVPAFMIWRQLGWYNTLNPLWVPSWFGIAFFIFLMVQQMKTIPRELEEAAEIDGLNPFQTWWYVIMPQVKPSLAAIAIMSFMGAWNEFMGPLIYLRDQALFPLSIGLFGIRIDADIGSDWTVIMAGNVLMTLPVLVIFFLFQRYFIQGVTLTGMKG